MRDNHSRGAVLTVVQGMRIMRLCSHHVKSVESIIFYTYIMDKFINIDYRVVVECRNSDGHRQFRRLFGRSGLVSLLGRQTYQRVIRQAYAQNFAKYSCRPRKNIVVTFYMK